MTDHDRMAKLEELLAAAVSVMKQTWPSRQSPSLNRIIDEADALLQQSASERK